MSHNCPICGVPTADRDWYEDPHGLVETHVECVEGCGMYEMSYSYGSTCWNVGHHTFRMPGEDHPAEDAQQRVHELVSRYCDILAERRFRQRVDLIGVCLDVEDHLGRVNPDRGTTLSLLLCRLRDTLDRIPEAEEAGGAE